MKYIILGAGPAGLSYANRLKKSGETSFLVLEREKDAGGLCRSVNVDNSPLDRGGGHFLDVRNKKVDDFLFEFMPKTEWNIFERDSRIKIHNQEISHPLEANIWQLDIDTQIRYLKSIALAGCNCNKEMPKRFVEWIYWKLGECIANDYMLPYNSKMFGEQLNELGTYWLDKLPNVSFEETLRSCIQHKAYGKEPGHSKFYYPRNYGYGELWRRMADILGEHILFNHKVFALDKGVVMTNSGVKFKADKIISTIPWDSFKINGMPEQLECDLKQLKHIGVTIEYIKEDYRTDAHWIYEPSLEIPYHRILLRKNFCSNSFGYWTETNNSRYLMGPEKIFYVNEYAYPLNTLHKNQIMQTVLKWARANNIFGLGRWGEHQHYNSDVTVERALNLMTD